MKRIVYTKTENNILIFQRKWLYFLNHGNTGKDTKFNINIKKFIIVPSFITVEILQNLTFS